MMRFIFILLVLISALIETDAQDVKATQPTIMIFPSDALVKKLGHLKRVEIDGRKRTFQDYEQLFIDESEFRLAVSQIQERFADKGFPLKDLEFSLKKINTQEAFDEVENIELDLKSILLKSAQPDIYLDLDYFYTGSGLSKKLGFNLRAIDAYTLKAVATASNSGSATLNNNLTENLVEQVENNIENLQSLMQKHFSDLRENGREISLRINVEKGAPIRDFRRERCSKKPYTRIFQDYIKRNTKKGAHHLDANSAKEVRYDVIRIPLFDAEGYPMGAAEWAYQFSEYLSDTCDVTVIDISSKLGEAHLLFISN